MKRLSFRNLILYSVIFSLMLAGCTSDNKNTVTKSNTFIGGSEGVTIAFLENAPPAEVFDNNTYPFDVSVKLENKGEYDVPKDKVKVSLSGIDRNEFNNPPVLLNSDEDLEKSRIDPNGKVVQGTVTYVNFPNLIYKRNLPGNTPFIIRADLCYQYGTVAQARMCIRNDLTSIEEGVCDPSGQKSVVSSGAPVQVSNFEQSPAGKKKITFSFDIEHRNTGLVSRKGNDCSDTLDQKNRVLVTVDTGDLTSKLSCSGLEGGNSKTSGYVNLYNGKRNVRCTQDLESSSGDFEKIVDIQLNYDYKDHVSTNVLVKDNN